MPPPAEGRFPQAAGERGLRREHMRILLCLPGRREQEKRCPLHTSLLALWDEMLLSLCIGRDDEVLLPGEAAASWRKVLIPKGVQARTGTARGLGGEEQHRDPGLDYSEDQA